MYDFNDYTDEDIDYTRVGGFRHACNVLGEEEMVTRLTIPPWRLHRLYESRVHGSVDLSLFLRIMEAIP